VLCLILSLSTLATQFLYVDKRIQLCRELYDVILRPLSSRGDTSCSLITKPRKRRQLESARKKNGIKKLTKELLDCSRRGKNNCGRVTIDRDESGEYRCRVTSCYTKSVGDGVMLSTSVHS